MMRRLSAFERASRGIVSGSCIRLGKRPMYPSQELPGLFQLTSLNRFPVRRRAGDGAPLPPLGKKLVQQNQAPNQGTYWQENSKSQVKGGVRDRESRAKLIYSRRRRESDRSDPG